MSKLTHSNPHSQDCLTEKQIERGNIVIEPNSEMKYEYEALLKKCKSFYSCYDEVPLPMQRELCLLFVAKDREEWEAFLYEPTDLGPMAMDFVLGEDNHEQLRATMRDNLMEYAQERVKEIVDRYNDQQPDDDNIRYIRPWELDD